MNYDFIINELKRGEVVCLPTDTVYGLFVMNESDSYKIYNIKKRSLKKPLGLYYSTNHDKYKDYYKIFGTLEGLTVIENNQAYRFCNILDPIIHEVGCLWGTSANESGYTPITNANHLKFDCATLNLGLCELGLESTVFSLDHNRILRYGYKYIEDLPEEFILPTYKINNSPIPSKDYVKPYNFWNYINNGYKPNIHSHSSYLSKLMEKTYNNIQFI